MAVRVEKWERGGGMGAVGGLDLELDKRAEVMRKSLWGLEVLRKWE